MATKFRFVPAGTPEPVTEPVVTLGVELLCAEGCTALRAFDVDHEPWYIVQLGSDGRLHRCGYIPDSLGLPLDSQGRVLLDAGSIVDEAIHDALGLPSGSSNARHNVRVPDDSSEL